MTTTTTPRRSDDPRVAIVGAALAVTAWGSAGVLINKIDMNATSIAVYRFALYSICICAWMAIRGTPLTLRALKASALGGLALGLDVAFFFEAVKRTTIVNATVIGALQPVVVGLVAWRLFGERVTRRDVFLGGVALVGVVVVVTGSSGAPDWNLSGDLLAVAATLAWSGYFIVSKQTQKSVTPMEYTAATAVITGALNFGVALAFGRSLEWPSSTSWIGLIALAIGAGVIGHSVMNWSLVRIPLWLGSVMTLLIPVAGAVLAWIFLDQPLNGLQIAAMALVLVTLGVLVAGQTDVTMTPEQFDEPLPSGPSDS